MISSLELAKLCGVSQGTVDRALHDRPGISAKTRAKILAAAEKYGYMPNPAARELMGLATSTMVGVITPDWSVRAPFFMDLFGALSACMRDSGLTLSLWLSRPGADGMRATFIDTAARRPRALVLVLPPDELDLPIAAVRRQPVFSLLLPCSCRGVINVLPDERAIGRVATEHLIGLGHRRIAHLHGPKPGHWASLERKAGYETALSVAKLVPNVIWDTCEAPDLIERIRRDQVTAVFCHNDPMALILIRRLRKARLRVPEDISVIGVDRSPILNALTPSISSVAYPFAGIAAQVVAHTLGTPVPALPVPITEPGQTTAAAG